MTAQLSTYGIGASEIAAVAGLNPYASPWDVWLRKTGQAPDVEQNEPMEWGNRLEPAIRQKYVDQTKEVVEVPSASVFHNVIPWARATPDGVALAPFRGKLATWKHLLQCKNVGTWVERAWKEAPPAYVQLQEQWELFVTNLQRADVAVLIGGNDFRVYSIYRDDALVNDLVSIASDFWERCRSRVAPEIDDSDACRDHFVGRLKKADAIELVADEQNEALFAEWKLLHAQQKAGEKRIKIIRNLVLADLVGAGADRLASTIGTATLRKGRSDPGGSVTNWRLVAELMGARAPDEFRELVAANTTPVAPTEGKPTLYVPNEWSKDS